VWWFLLSSHAAQSLSRVAAQNHVSKEYQEKGGWKKEEKEECAIKREGLCVGEGRK
jgi:hypothetical protein